MKDVSKFEGDPHIKLSNEKVLDNIKIQLELELSTSIFKNVHQKAIEENEKSFNANFNSFKYEKAFRAKKVQSQEIADSCGYYKESQPMDRSFEKHSQRPHQWISPKVI